MRRVHEAMLRGAFIALAGLPGLAGPFLLGCSSSGEGADAATSDGSLGGADGSNHGSDGGSSTTPPGDATSPLDGGGASDDAGSFALANLDEPCEGGPTGRALLAYVESRYVGTYVPPPSHANAGTTGLTITASYDGGGIVCTPAPPFNCCPGCPCRTPPPPSVSVNLAVGFKTDDGTLDESLPAVAVFSPDAYLATWTATAPRAMVRGTYAFSNGSTALEFTGTFRNATTQGDIAEQGPTAPGSSTLSGGTWTGTADAGGG